MSDLQDLIATNAVRAYNEGFERGAVEERERIIKLLEEHTHSDATEYLIDCDLCERYYGVGLAIALIKGEQK